MAALVRPPAASVKRSAAVFGAATVAGHASQLVWLAAGSRVMTLDAFGAVLAAQALYAVLQIMVDVGTAAVGARLVAQGELTDERRAELVRIRMLLVTLAAVLAVALGTLGVSGSLATTLPFVAALYLFGALNVWEPYGRGDARPWATYMFTRSAVPGAAALGCLALGASFPAPLAGGLECLVLVIVMLVYRQRPFGTLRAAARVRGGPWSGVMSVGVSSAMWQGSVASGTLVLSGSGNVAAAGVFAACVRLLTGLNAINGIVATALYPRLARQRGHADGDGRLVVAALQLITLLGAGATACAVLADGVVMRALLGVASGRAEAALVLTTAAVLALGNIVMLAYQMVARGHERDMIVPFAIGAIVTTGAAVGVVLAGGPRVDLVAAALLAGQLFNMAILSARVRRRCPDLRAAVAWSAVAALAVALLAGVSLAGSARLPAAAALGGLAVAMLVRLTPLVRAQLAPRRRRASVPIEPAGEVPR